MVEADEDILLKKDAELPIQVKRGVGRLLNLPTAARKGC